MIETVGGAAFGIIGYLWTPEVQVPYLIGPNVKYIGMWAFGQWDYRLPLHLPDNVEYIGTQAFSGYKKNGNYIVIPRNVTYIGPNAFYDYGQSLDEDATVIMYPEIPPVIESDDGPFNLILRTIYVPTGTRAAYVSAWSEYWARIAERYPERVESNIDIT